MSDQLIKSIAYDGQIRIYVADATETVKEAQERHGTLSNATAALGRTLIATGLIGATLDDGDTITTRIQGDGPLGYIVADGNEHGEVKGYVQNPHISLDLNEENKIDVKGAVGTQGILAVTKDIHMREPSVGSVPLISGEIAEDFTYYMASSEQTPSSFGLSVLVNPDESVESAGGFMIQVLPGVEDETLDRIEQNLTNLPPVSSLMKEGKTSEDILNLLAAEGNPKVLTSMPISFKCDCSKEKFTSGLASIGDLEIQKIIEEDGKAEVVCHFCQNTYHYSKDELESIKEQA